MTYNLIKNQSKMYIDGMDQKTDIMQWDNLSHAERIAIKLASERSFEAFLRIFFQLLQGQKFLKNWHHTYACQLAESVYYGKIKRGVINVAPGSTKTEIWSIHWIAWCIIKSITDDNPRSTRWLPLSYSDDLVTENSIRVKEIIDSEPFQAMWPLTRSKTTKSSSNWLYTDDHGNFHRLYGTSTGGQVTGRRGGYMIPGFSGAIILDDPLPPKSADSGLLMDKSNKMLNRVVRSRLAHDDIPIIMIQQRIAKGDSTDFLNSSYTPDTYQMFKVPALIDNEYINSLPDDMREACIRDTEFNGGRCSYWPAKEPTETLLKMEKADNYMFSAQYQQSPDDALIEGVVYKKEIDLLIADDRLCNIPVERHLPVYTFWDLGLNDHMTVWLMQPYQRELRMIACYGNRDEGMAHYINWLSDFSEKYAVRYEKHLGPHDLAVRNLLTKRSRIDEAKEMGITFTLVERCKNKLDSINALKALFPRIWIDKIRCDTDASGKTGDFADKTGWKALKALRRDWDHNNERFKDDVGPKWATDFTDALQQMGLHYKDKLPTQPTKKQPRRSSGGWMSG
jgi:hypothetical protein